MGVPKVPSDLVLKLNLLGKGLTPTPRLSHGLLYGLSFASADENFKLHSFKEKLFYGCFSFSFYFDTASYVAETCLLETLREVTTGLILQAVSNKQASVT